MDSFGSVDAMIRLVREAPGSHVVLGLTNDGARLRCESETACQVLAHILGDSYKVIPREEFLTAMEQIKRDEEEEAADLSKPTYTCSACHGVFNYGWSEEESQAEAKKLWGERKPEEMCVICDDCFQGRMGKTNA